MGDLGQAMRGAIPAEGMAKGELSSTKIEGHSCVAASFICTIYEHLRGQSHATRESL